MLIGVIIIIIFLLEMVVFKLKMNKIIINFIMLKIMIFTNLLTMKKMRTEKFIITNKCTK